MIPFLAIAGVGLAAVVLTRRRKPRRGGVMSEMGVCPTSSKGRWSKWQGKFSPFGKRYGEFCAQVSVEYAPGTVAVKPGGPFVLNLNFELQDGDTYEVRVGGQILDTNLPAPNRVVVWVPGSFTGTGLGRADDPLLFSIWPENLAFDAIKLSLDGGSDPLVRVNPHPGKFTVAP